MQIQIFLFRICAFFIVLYAKFCYFTSKKIHINENSRQNFAKLGREDFPVIVMFFHSRLVMLPIITPKKLKRKSYAVTSSNKDGELVEFFLKFLGIKCIRGSSDKIRAGNVKTKGGANVLKQALKILRQKGVLIITPDGPKGPARKVKPNIFAIAQKTQAKILPVSLCLKPAITFNTWDKLQFPLPFSKIYINIGGATDVAKTTSIQEEKAKIETELNKLTDEVDNFVP